MEDQLAKLARELFESTEPQKDTTETRSHFAGVDLAEFAAGGAGLAQAPRDEVKK